MMAIKPKVFKKDGKQRFGRGFSLEELKKAGLDPRDALKYGVPVDAKRKTAHEGNIEVVKAFLQEKEAALKPKKTKRKPKS